MSAEVNQRGKIIAEGTQPYGTLAVGTTAVAFNPGGADYFIHNPSDSIIYMGDANVLSTTGFPINATSGLPFAISDGVYFICGVVSKEIRFIKAT